MLKLIGLLWLAAGVGSVLSCIRLCGLRKEWPTEVFSRRVYRMIFWAATAIMLISLGFLSLGWMLMLMHKERKNKGGD